MVRADVYVLGAREPTAQGIVGLLSGAGRGQNLRPGSRKFAPVVACSDRCDHRDCECSRGPCRAVRPSSQGPCPSAVLAWQGWARLARTGARQLPFGPGLVRPGGPVRRVAAGQPAHRVWSARGDFSEGTRRLGAVLELVPDDDPERVDALSSAAWLATDQGDRASAIPLLDESIERP